MTAESFLHSLSSGQTIISPSQITSFSTLESPSTPTLIHSSPLDRRASSTSSRRKSSTSSVPTTEPRTPPPTVNVGIELQNERTPYYRKNDRLMAFKPSIATTFPPQSISKSIISDLPTELVAAQVHGMGRIVISKNILMETFGKRKTEKVIEEASIMPNVIAFGEISQPILKESLPILETFSSIRNAGKGRGVEAPAMLIDDRMSSIKLWLDSPEMMEEDSRDGWSFIPKEWDQDLDRFKSLTSKNDQSLLSPLGDGPGDIELVEEIRVGGKSVKVLLKTKKRRVEELGENFDEPVRTTTDPSNPFLENHIDRKGKGKANCICGEGRGESMLQCDDCRTWFHFECLNIPNRRLSSEWFCFRCTGGFLPALPRTQSYSNGLLSKPSHPSQSMKRNKSTGGIPTTPTLSFAEPTLVETSFTPSSKGNFYTTAKPDMALAPSPQSSPIAARRVPSVHYSPSHSRSHSEVSHITATTVPGSNLRIVPHPATPHFREIGNDYSPRSPTGAYFRTNRTRVISTGQQLFEEQSLQSQNWVAGGEGVIFESTLPTGVIGEDSSLGEDGFHSKGWDLNSTPSRSLNLFGISTPLTSSTRRTAFTPSQDFLSGLHQTGREREDSSQNYSIAQKLFSHTNNSLFPPSPDSAGRTLNESYYGHPGSSYAGPSSPLGKRNSLASPQMMSHRRVPSNSGMNLFPSSPTSNPVLFKMSKPKVELFRGRSESVGLFENDLDGEF